MEQPTHRGQSGNFIPFFEDAFLLNFLKLCNLNKIFPTQAPLKVRVLCNECNTHLVAAFVLLVIVILFHSCNGPKNKMLAFVEVLWSATTHILQTSLNLTCMERKRQ
jgi:hypothetical protein